MAAQFWQIRSYGETYALVRAMDASRHQGLAQVPPEEAAFLVESLPPTSPVRDRSDREVLLRILTALDGHVSLAANRELEARVAEALRRGRLVCFRTTGVTAVEQHRQVEPLGPSEDDTTWIEIELVDEDKEAVPDERYVIETADGRKIEGRTNVSGRAREEGLQPGSCKVSFPDLDPGSWKSA